MFANASEGARKTSIAGTIGDLGKRRWLVWYFIQRQLTQSYRGSFLGLSWLLLGPLLMVALYTLVFSEIIGLRFSQTDSVSNYGLYVYCGFLPFFAFSQTTTKSTRIIRGNSNLVKRVVFPLEILPLSTAVTSFISQLFGFVALTGLLLVFEGGLNWTLLLLPVIFIPQIAFLVGLGCLVSVAGVYLPDLQEAVTALVRIMLFATPIIWPAEMVPDHLWFIVDLNPLAAIVGSFRALALEGQLPDASAFAYLSVFSLALFAVGVTLFVKTKQKFADVV